MKKHFPWFKLDAIAFLHSNAVGKMSVEEVGQYVLLLMHSWVQANGCQLPANTSELARIIRSTKPISRVVLLQFPIIKHDSQGIKSTFRRNKVLFDAWQESERVSDKARNAAKIGHSKVANAARTQNERGAPALPDVDVEVMLTEADTTYPTLPERGAAARAGWWQAHGEKTLRHGTPEQLAELETLAAKYGHRKFTAMLEEWRNRPQGIADLKERTRFFLQEYHLHEEARVPLTPEEVEAVHERGKQEILASFAPKRKPEVEIENEVELLLGEEPNVPA